MFNFENQRNDLNAFNKLKHNQLMTNLCANVCMRKREKHAQDESSRCSLSLAHFTHAHGQYSPTRTILTHTHALIRTLTHKQSTYGLRPKHAQFLSHFTTKHLHTYNHSHTLARICTHTRTHWQKCSSCTLKSLSMASRYRSPNLATCPRSIKTFQSNPDNLNFLGPVSPTNIS